MRKKLVSWNGRCQSCGDKTKLFEYNKARTCASCLGMDNRGIFVPYIFDRNTGQLKYKEVRDYWKTK